MLAGGKRDVAVLRTDGRNDGEVADLKVTGPVGHRQRKDRVAGRDLLRDPPSSAAAEGWAL